MKLRFNYRIYPTKQQRILLAKQFGCNRVVWNDALAIIKNCPAGIKWPSISDLQKFCITQAKKTEQREWLKEVSAVPLQQSIQDLGVAFKNFFDSRKGKRKGPKMGFPKFKKKSHEQSARFNRNGFGFKDLKLGIAKVGFMKVKWSRPLPAEPSSVTITKNRADQFHASFVVDFEPYMKPARLPSVGIDLGLKIFAVLSTGQHQYAPDYSDLERKARRAQRTLSRRVKGSNGWHRARLRLAKINLKIANRRKNFLHKLSTKLVQTFSAIYLEDLNVSGMVKNRKLAKAISRQGWRMFRNMLQAKCVMYGRVFKVIDRWAPTSQYCSTCGYRWGKLDLKTRTIKCANCQTVHCRDGNAAVNIDNVGNGQKLGWN